LSKIYAVLLFLLVFSAARLPASARQEEKEAAVSRDEWILCITNIDTSALSAQRRQAGDLILSALSARLNNINFRARVSPEYAYYEEVTWTRDKAAAAKALSDKQNERSAYIYRGEPDWRYKRNIAAIDAEIEKLRANLARIENDPPLINKEPLFKLASVNLNNIFPSAPSDGRERRFCSEQGIDAFLALSITEFHGRFLLDMRLYTIYTNSFSWRDSTLFSHNDMDEALDEIIQRLLIALTGNRSVTVAVRSLPRDALILINSSFAGRGGEITGVYPPGAFIIDASRAEYESLTYQTVVTEGQTLDINLVLNPVLYGFLEVSSEIPSSIYQGALYLGETPLTLRLPLGSMEYIEMESADINKTAAVFQMPASGEAIQSLSFDTIRPLRTGNINNDRNFYYWIYGGTWITGIATWIVYNTYMSSNYAIFYNYSSSGTFNNNFNKYNQSMYYATMGTAIAFGAVASYGVYRLVRYIITADRTAAVSVRTGRK